MTAVPIDHSHRRKEPINRRTGQKVRRHSIPVGGREQWPFYSWANGRKMLQALRIYSEGLRQKGQRTGAKGTISFGALRLAELMAAVAAKYRGRLEPSAEWMAKQLNVPEKSIHAWKAQLKAHGFLNWRRRYIETGRHGIRGPQVVQTSNAYWLKIPEAAARAVAKALGPKAPRGWEDRLERRERLYQAAPELRDALDKLGAHFRSD